MFVVTCNSITCIPLTVGVHITAGRGGVDCRNVLVNNLNGSRGGNVTGRERLGEVGTVWDGRSETGVG